MILDERQARCLQRGYHAAHVIRLTEGVHDRAPFRAPAREPKPGTFHRPAHGFGMKRVAEAAVNLVYPMWSQVVDNDEFDKMVEASPTASRKASAN
jgi:hypothetical protein